MSLILIIATSLVMVLPQPIGEAASFTISKSSVTLDIGKTSTITINAPTHTGRINISSSNSGVASVNMGSFWAENNSQTITITAKSAGNATITISGEVFDSTTEEEHIYTKTISVTVNKPKEETNTGGNTGGSTGGNGNGSGSTSGGTSSGGSSSSGNTSSGSNGSSSSSGSTSAGTSSNKPSSGSTSTTKPSTGATSKPSSDSTSKPSGSSQTTTSKPVQNTTVNNNTNVNQEQKLPVENVEENIQQENFEQIDMNNETEHILNEEKIETDLNVNKENANEAENKEMEVVNNKVPNQSVIIIAAISIAVILTCIGIIIVKKVFRK